MTRVDCVFFGERPEPDRFWPPTMEVTARLGDEERMRPVGKPNGGLWTCRLDPARADSGRDWARYCEGAEWRRPRAGDGLWRLSAPEPTLLTLSDAASLRAAVERWPSSWLDRVDPGSRLTLGRAQFAEIDYVAVAADGYHGVELTPRGLVESRLAWPLLLPAWDVPSILWLAWCFDRVEPLKEPEHGP